MLKVYIVPSDDINLTEEYTLLDIRESAVDIVEGWDYSELVEKIVTDLNNDSLDTNNCWFFLVEEDNGFETILISPFRKDLKQKIVETIEDLVENTYTYVPWPDSQDYMDEEWFDEEAILDVNNSSAYFIPTKYVQ